MPKAMLRAMFVKPGRRKLLACGSNLAVLTSRRKQLSVRREVLAVYVRPPFCLQVGRLRQATVALFGTSIDNLCAAAPVLDV